MFGLPKNIDHTWTLFLDRDGVINQKLEADYVKHWQEFEFIEGIPEAIRQLSNRFGKTVIVTNQQGIGKGLMSEQDLKVIHDNMVSEIESAGGKIDRIYYCPHLATEGCRCRKPAPGMAEQAKNDFPEIDFTKSVLIGDSYSDIEFGENSGMITVWLKDGKQLNDVVRHLKDA